jgi:hypothetical protein
MPSLYEKLLALSSDLPVSWSSLLAKAASLRAPVRGETRVLAVTATSKMFEVPNGTTTGTPQWTGRIVNVYADGADVYLQVSNALDAVVDDAASSVETAQTSPARFRISAHASNQEGWLIPKGQWVPIAFDSTNLSFAVKCATGSTAKLRTHVAES